MALHLTRINELAVVTLDQPEVLNALNFELLRESKAQSRFPRWVSSTTR